MPKKPNSLDGNLNPWQIPPLDSWSICGMNHYHVEGEKYLFVSMVKDGKCVTEEGKDDKYLWNRLWHQVTELNGVGERECRWSMIGMTPYSGCSTYGVTSKEWVSRHKLGKCPYCGGKITEVTEVKE